MKKGTKNYFSLKFINPIIRIMTISDLLVVSSFGLIAPIFAIFVTDSISGGDVAVVGLAQAIYLIARSVFQVPFAFLLDKIKGESDDFWTMLIVSIVLSLVPLFYMIIGSVWQLFLVQFIYGSAEAVLLPAWNAIWLRHIDKGHESVESGVYSTLVGLGGALTASLGGLIAANYGFNPLFILVSILMFTGSIFLLMIYKKIIPDDKRN